MRRNVTPQSFEPGFTLGVEGSVAAEPDTSWSQDIHLITLSTLIDHKIITLSREELVRASQATPQERRIPGGQYLLPPWCVWPLPASTDLKAASRKNQTMCAPPMFFLGAPTKALAAAGISPSQTEVEAHANDPEWTYDSMRAVRDAGGFIYGGLWATVRFPFNAGVDSSDIQRLLEWSMDQLAMKTPNTLKSYLLGVEKPFLEIDSQRKARKLVTNLDSELSTRTAWNKLAHPSFYTFTRTHQGPITSETIGEIRIFNQITQHLSNLKDGTNRGKLGKALSATLEISQVGVALAVGQAARMSHIIGDPDQRAFNPQGIQVLSDWLWDLKDRERRLARHLILSPGDSSGYAYLREQAYSAAVMGFRFVDDRRYRHRALQDLLKSAGKVGELLENLPLDGARAHLRKAIQSLGVEVVSAPIRPLVPKNREECSEPSGNSASISDNLPLSVTPPFICDNDLPQSVTPPFICDNDLPQSVTPPVICDNDLPQSVTPPVICDEPPSICDDDLPRSVTEISKSPYFSRFSSSLISYSFSLGYSLSVSPSVHNLVPFTPRVTDGLADGRTDSSEFPSVPEGENKEEPKPKAKRVQKIRPMEDWGPDGEMVQDWMATKDSAPWPEQLTNALNQLVDQNILGVVQVPRILRDSPFTAEGAWAIIQGVLQQTAPKSGQSSSPWKARGGMLFKALLKPEKASPYLNWAGRLLRECGATAEVTDGTSHEPYGRRILSEKLAKAGIKRLPLSREESKKCAAIQMEEERKEETRHFAATTILPDYDTEDDFDTEDSGQEQGKVEGKCPSCTPSSLPWDVRTNLIPLSHQFKELCSRRAALTREAMRTVKSSDVLKSPAYMEATRQMCEVSTAAKTFLDTWGGKIQIKGTVYAFGPESETSEQAIRMIMQEVG